MITMDIFNNDAFSVTTMLEDIEKRPYQPTGLADLMGFEVVPVSTDTVGVGVMQGRLSLIRTTLRGAPIEAAEPDTRNARQFKIPRIAKGDKLFIHELANTAPFKGEGDVETAARVIARKQEQLVTDVDFTLENHMFGALRGVVLDANGDTLVNFHTEFGIAVPAAIDLDLDNPTPPAGKLRRDIQSLIVRPIARASQAGNAPRFRVRALCGDAFFDRLTSHPDVERTYLNYAAASELRNANIWEPFPFAGVDWINYRGADDGTTMGIPTNEAEIFPTGVPRMFQHIQGPCNEMAETVNQMGRRYYPVLERDLSVKQQWVQPEIYSYPLMLNRRPDLRLRAQI